MASAPLPSRRAASVPGRGRVFDSIAQTIGDTPVVRLNRFCLSEHYRRCDLYRRFLDTLAHEPERWRLQGPRSGTPTGDDAGLPDSIRARKP